MSSALFKVDLGSSPIFSLEDLVSRLTPHFKSYYEKIDPQFAAVFSESSTCSFNLVQSLYKKKEHVHNKTLQALLELIFVSRLLKENQFSDDFYQIATSSVKIAKNIKNFEIEFLVDEMVTKQLEIFEMFKDQLVQLNRGYKFVHDLSVLLMKKVDMQEDLETLAIPICSLLYAQIESSDIFRIPHPALEEVQDQRNKEALDQYNKKVRENRKKVQKNEAKVKNIIQSVLASQASLVDMTDFKFLLKFIIDECKTMDSISSDFDYSELDEVKAQGFAPVVEEELPEIIYEQRDYQQVIEKIKRVETIYVKRETQHIRVHKCILEETGEIFALKEVTASTADELTSFKQEAAILENLSNTGENFLKFYAARHCTVNVGNQVKHKFEILMEFVERDLKKLKIDRNNAGNPFNEDEIKLIYEQLITTFNILRNRNILHCDIKPSNILVTDDLKLKIIDFGIARTSINDATLSTGAFGTKDFMAPEIKKALKGTATLKSDKADVYSLGMTILYLLVKDFPSDLNDEKNQKVLQNLIRTIPFIWVREPLQKMLEFDYKKRADFKSLISIFATIATKGKTLTL